MNDSNTINDIMRYLNGLRGGYALPYNLMIQISLHITVQYV